MIPITFVDLETTGLDSNKAEIIELAAVKTEISDGKLVIVDSAEFKVVPQYPVDPAVAKLNGYNEEEWGMYGESETVAVGAIFNLMRGCWHAGSNPKFDEAFLRYAAERFNWEYPKLASYHIIDVTMLAFHLLINGTVETLKQETIAKHYEIGGGGHRAMADALQCARLFAKINNLEFQWSRP